MASICSEHKIEDPNCPRCRCQLDLTINDDRIVTCPTCNFVFYKASDTCPMCQTENI